MSKNVIDLFRLDGHRAVVIGGAGGLGKAMALGLAQAGATVAVASRNLDNCKKVADEITQATGRTAYAFSVDATKEESIQKLADDAAQAMGGAVDILVNSQGVNLGCKSMDYPVDEFARTMEINVTGVMTCCKVFAKGMKDLGWGRIINISSVTGITCPPPGAFNWAYPTSKAALNHLTEVLGVEFAPYGIRVNGIGPSLTPTPLVREHMESDPEGLKRYLANIPVGHLATPEDCVGPLLFLASDAANNVVGQTIYPDGGQTRC